MPNEPLNDTRLRIPTPLLVSEFASDLNAQWDFKSTNVGGRYCVRDVQRIHFANWGKLPRIKMEQSEEGEELRYSDDV